MNRGIIKLLVEIVAYVFIDIPFLDSHSLYLFEKRINVAQGQSTANHIPKYGRIEGQSYP